jgi:hypothetical protein
VCGGAFEPSASDFLIGRRGEVDPLKAEAWITRQKILPRLEGRIFARENGDRLEISLLGWSFGYMLYFFERLIGLPT